MVATTKDAYDLLHQGTKTLARIEANGIRIDTDYLDSAIVDMTAEISKLVNEIKDDPIYTTWKRRFGRKTNIGAPDQLAYILYDVKGLECKHRTKTGKPKMDDETLKSIDDPFVNKYREVSKLKKVNNTFLKGIREEVVDGFLHPFYNLNTTETFRSCVAKGTMVEVVRNVKDRPEGIPIEEVKEGDYVYTYNDNLQLTIKKVLWAGKTGRKKVVRIHWVSKKRKGYLDVTPEHLIRIANGDYVRADSLMDQVDTRICDMKKRRFPKRSVLAMARYSDGERISETRGNQYGEFHAHNHCITKVEQLNHFVDVYDIEVEDTHNFIANELCVHNSSNDPNFQNFPARNKKMKKIVRSAFIPREGRQLGEIDFKAIEVAIAACYHKDPTMITYLKDPTKDMHRDMAMDCYCLTKEQVNSDSRYCAKNKFVFPQFYGDFYPRCAASLYRAIDQMNLVVGDPKDPNAISLKQHLKSKGITKLGKCDPEQKPLAGTFEKHIKDIEDNFWNNRFPVYSQWKKDWWNAYKRNGCFRTKTGFLIAGVYKRNQVINYPVQGSAFHCLLWTLIKLQAWLDKKRMKSLIVGQIHDSMLIDFHPPEIPRILNKIKCLVKEELPAHWKWINVPLSVEIEIAPLGKSWFDKVEVKI